MSVNIQRIRQGAGESAHWALKRESAIAAAHRPARFSPKAATYAMRATRASDRL
jgi:hypothetical protein